jgi:hypothetical protein
VLVHGYTTPLNGIGSALVQAFGRPEEVEMETDTEAITAVLRKYAAYCNSGDFESWIALWEVMGVRCHQTLPVVLELTLFERRCSSHLKA